MSRPHLADTVACGLAILLMNSAVGLGAESVNWGRDPFTDPPVPTNGAIVLEAAMEPRNLEGIVVGPDGPVAIIDSRIVHVGDQLGSERVMKITPDTVVLQQRSRIRHLTISIATNRER